MYVRLAFAVAAHLEPDILIVDEVLAVGDAGFQKRCLGKMGDVARQGRTVLFVSHNMAAIQKLCSRAIWLQNGQVAMDGESGSVVSAYVDATVETAGDQEVLSPGFLFRDASNSANDAEVVLESLQVLDSDLTPLSAPGTWQEIIFRFNFGVSRPFQSFAVEMCITTREGVPLLLTSTTPDNHMAFSVEPGHYQVDCRFASLPLAAGEYLIGVRLAIPWVEYLWRDDALCRLHVSERDVWGTGLPPASSRYHIATPHEWNGLKLLETAQ
jgi:lipopolysaccharide transport system ATP-binding protein